MNFFKKQQNKIKKTPSQTQINNLKYFQMDNSKVQIRSNLNKMEIIENI